MGKLVYTLVSSAYFVDEKWGFGSPHAGMKVMASIAHEPRNGKTVPVTWLVSPKSAIIESDLLTRYHEGFGDVVGYMLTFEGHGMNRHATLLQPDRHDDLVAHVAAEIGIIKDALPWADIRILGTGYRSNSLVSACEKLNISGLWGNCPFQIGTDGITDFGAPFGQWYVNPANYKKPARMMGKVMSMEWTARDLNKSFHLARPEAYSTDPNDVESESKCTATNVAYWTAIMDQYARNLHLNDYLFIHQHQEAHEMDTKPVCIPFTRERVDLTARMLGTFLDHVTARDDVVIVDGNKALSLFHEHYKGIQPAVLAYFEDIPIHELCPEYKAAVKDSVAKPKHVWLSFNETFFERVERFVETPGWLLQEPPWKHAFFYYDADCMLVFDKPHHEPAWICNYTDEEGRPWDDELMLSEPVVPEARVVERAQEGGDALEVHVAVESPKFMPYGVAIWGADFNACTVSASTYTVTPRVINDGLLFARCNLQQGTNAFTLTVAGKDR